jgi:transcriptional regulator with XRE-family HTH domain
MMYNISYKNGGIYMINSIMGERIKERREALGKNQRWLASELGVDRCTVSRYESGSTRKIALLTLEKMSEVLETTKEYLLYGTGPIYAGGAADDIDLRAPVPKYSTVYKQSEVTDENIDAICHMRILTINAETEDFAPRVIPGDILTIVVDSVPALHRINAVMRHGTLCLMRIDHRTDIPMIDRVVGYVEKMETKMI